MTPKAPAKRPGPRRQPRIDQARLAEMIEEATVDAHDESEQATGWFRMFEQHLARDLVRLLALDRFGTLIFYGTPCRR